MNHKAIKIINHICILFSFCLGYIILYILYCYFETIGKKDFVKIAFKIILPLIAICDFLALPYEIQQLNKIKKNLHANELFQRRGIVGLIMHGISTIIVWILKMKT